MYAVYKITCGAFKNQAKNAAVCSRKCRFYARSIRVAQGRRPGAASASCSDTSKIQRPSVQVRERERESLQQAVYVQNKFAPEYHRLIGRKTSKTTAKVYFTSNEDALATGGLCSECQNTGAGRKKKPCSSDQQCSSVVQPAAATLRDGPQTVQVGIMTAQQLIKKHRNIENILRPAKCVQGHYMYGPVNMRILYLYNIRWYDMIWVIWYDMSHMIWYDIIAYILRIIYICG